MNWQRHHSRDNANCTVSIWDKDKKQWVEKEDTGKESNTEAEKGLASDSFKRACFNWGIGRELYTAPDMWVGAKDLKTLKEVEGYQGKKKWECKDTFVVTEIEYSGKNIAFVKVLNQKTNNEIVFGTPAKESEKIEDIGKMKIAQIKVDALASKAVADGVPLGRICTLYKVADIESMNEKQYRNCMDNWQKIKEME
jgi:hypothetical protein